MAQQMELTKQAGQFANVDARIESTEVVEAKEPEAEPAQGTPPNLNPRTSLFWDCR